MILHVGDWIKVRHRDGSVHCSEILPGSRCVGVDIDHAEFAPWRADLLEVRVKEFT